MQTKIAIGVSAMAFVGGLALSYWILSEAALQQGKAEYLIGIDLYEKGQHQRAAAALNQAVAKNPADYSPYCLLGDVYSKLGNNELAIETYKTALALLDASGERRENVTRATLQRKIEELTAATKSKPNSG